jgi:hypothetical protein
MLTATYMCRSSDPRAHVAHSNTSQATISQGHSFTPVRVSVKILGAYIGCLTPL